MSKKVRKLPGKVCRVLSFLPYVNCLSLVHLGFATSERIHIYCAFFYAAIYVTQPSAFFVIWVLAFVQYTVFHLIATIHRNQKRQQTSRVRQKANQTQLNNRQKSSQSSRKISQTNRNSSQTNRNTTNRSIIPNNRDLASLYKKPNQSKTATRAPSYSPNSSIGQSRMYRSTMTQSVATPLRTNNLGATIRQKFFEDMKKYEWLEGKPSSFTPFMCYSPTYDNMNRLQKDWYFYWRAEVRKHHYLETDLSYLFLYIYELLSSCGCKDATEAVITLIEIWKQYRELFPKLDAYLPAWIYDMIQINQLEASLLLEHEVTFLTPSILSDQLIDGYAEGIPLKLPFPLVNVLCDYDITNSKFYKDGNAGLMRQAIPRVIALADASLRKSSGEGLLVTYGPNVAVQRDYVLFRGAVCPRADEKISVNVKNYTAYQKLREYVNELVRTGENALRSIYGYNGRLRGITLPEEMTKLILVFLKKEYDPKKAESTQEEATKIELDFASIEQLRAESEEVREALEVEKTVSQTQKALLTEVPEVSAIYLNIPQESRDLLAELKESEWEMEQNEENQVLIEDINRISERYLGCSILVTEGNLILAEDDYRDELEYVLENPPEIPEDEGETCMFHLEALTPELAELLEALLPEQQEIIALLLTKETAPQEIEMIAEESMTMPELIYDGINEIAMQILGDILIDNMDGTPKILEEYQEQLLNSIGEWDDGNNQNESERIRSLD